MKCKLCDEKKGSTRCEGCGILLCLPCINKHQNELMQQFQQLLNMRNELKESINTVEKTVQHGNQLLCFIEIDLWEKETIERIQASANRIRTSINVIMAKNLFDIHLQLEQLSATMEQQQKEENYLEDDLEYVKLQLNQLKDIIPHMNEKIHVIASNDIDWDSLVQVTTSDDLTHQNNNRSKVQTDQEKQSHITSTSRYHDYEPTIFRPTAPVLFESNNQGSFRSISPPGFPSADCLSATRNSPLIPNIAPSDRIIFRRPILGQSTSLTTVPKSRQNT